MQNPKLNMFMKKIADKACALKRGKVVRYRWFSTVGVRASFHTDVVSVVSAVSAVSVVSAAPPTFWMYHFTAQRDNDDDWLAQYSKHSTSSEELLLGNDYLLTYI